MQTHRTLFEIGGSVLVALFLLCGTAHAAEMEKPRDIGAATLGGEIAKIAGEDISGTLVAADVKEEKSKVKECIEGLPCAKRHPNGSETAENGAVCQTSSWVCSNPYPSGQKCGMNNTGTCHTYEVISGGGCDCVCITP